MYGALVPQVKCVDGWLKKTSVSMLYSRCGFT